MKGPALPVTRRVEAHWVEQLDADHEVVRVLVADGEYLYRVVPHGDRSWRVEKRERRPWGPTWSSLRGVPRGRYGVRPVRMWRSPQAAMAAAEGAAALPVLQPQKGTMSR